jgi:hypothetical protein
MASGQENRLTCQIGEHLVAAELGRRGYIATPFSGNVPVFDLLAASHAGHAIPIQVKAIKGPSWQSKVDRFLRIEIKKGVQRVRGITTLAHPELICIFVKIGERLGADRFYIFQLKDLQKHFLEHYRGGRRPKNPLSLHCAVWPEELVKFEANWKLIDEAFSKVSQVASKAQPQICDVIPPSM